MVGDAAELFDPSDPDDMARAVDVVVGDDGRRAELAAAAPGRVAAHTWGRTAELTLAGYQQALSQRAPGLHAAPEPRR